MTEPLKPADDELPIDRSVVMDFATAILQNIRPNVGGFRSIFTDDGISADVGARSFRAVMSGELVKGSGFLRTMRRLFDAETRYRLQTACDAVADAGIEAVADCNTGLLPLRVDPRTF